MKKRLIASLVAIVTLAIANVGFAMEPIEPIAPAKDINVAQAELGKKLFFDPRLSKSGFISCNS